MFKLGVLVLVMAGHKNKRSSEAYHSDLPNAVRQVVKYSLTRGHPVIGNTAQALHLSVRSLQRQLAEQGTTYSQLVEEVRYWTACEYLTQNKLPIHSIAEQLGYSDTASFSRVFVNWEGVSPSIYRKLRAQQQFGNRHLSD